MADSYLLTNPFLRCGSGRRRAACVTAQMTPVRAHIASTVADNPVGISQPVAVLRVVVEDVVVSSGVERRRRSTLTSGKRAPQRA